MKYRIIEIRTPSGAGYEKKQLNEITGSYELIDIVKIKSVIIDEDNAVRYMYLYDNKGNVIDDVFRYLNIEIIEQEFNTRHVALNALKTLFTFVELFNIKYKNITEFEAKRFKHFVYGQSQKGSNYTMELITKRSTDTFNQYCSTYRRFYKYLNIDDSPFHNARIVAKNHEYSLLENKATEVRFVLNDTSEQDKQKVPMYVKIDDFKKIIAVIRKEYSLREEIIVRLEYECGLRIGEVLGLTLEDIITKPNEIQMKAPEDIGCIIVRNRLSDNENQRSKSIWTPKTTDDYLSTWYLKEHIGFDLIWPSIDLLWRMDLYIQEAHGFMSKSKRRNYLVFAKADRVTEGINLSNGMNYYIFLNKNGAKLNQTGWNKTLREIFIKAGLGIDKSVRQHNLNHRLRHGFAMFHVKYKHANELDLKVALRHNSLSSVSCYFRPDEDDLRKANLAATESLFSLFPELQSDN